MAAPQFSDDGRPRPATDSPTDRLRGLVGALLPLLTALVALLAGIMIYQAATMGDSPSQTTVSYASSASPSSSTYPPELVEAAIALSTSLAPTPIPSPTTMPYETPTQVSPDFCTSTTLERSICTQPYPPEPPPTALPICPTSPGQDCVWMGSAGGATPIAWPAATPQTPSTTATSN